MNLDVSRSIFQCKYDYRGRLCLHSNLEHSIFSPSLLGAKVVHDTQVAPNGIPRTGFVMRQGKFVGGF